MPQTIYEGSEDSNYTLGVDTNYENFVAFGVGDGDGRLTARLAKEEVGEVIEQLCRWYHKDPRCTRCNASKGKVPWSARCADLCAECESELCEEATYLDHADYEEDYGDY